MMKVDSQPFPQANVVELSDLRPEGQNFAFQINMAGPICHRDEQSFREANSGKQPQDEDESEQQHITEEQVCHSCNQL